MNYNRELKAIDTEVKAYFLGFMFADGCISNIKRKNSAYVKPQVQISLTDEEIIIRFLKEFPFFNLQIFDFGKYKSTWSKQYALRKADKNLFNDLKSHGIIERKSENLDCLLKLPQLEKSLIPAFIRGYFDGDGSVFYLKDRKNVLRAEICCGSSYILLEIKKLLESSGINCPVFRTKHNNKSPLYVLEWFTTTQTLQLGEYLYKNSTIHLDRKKEKFDNFKIFDKKTLNPKCSCGGLTTKKGQRKTKKGLVCRFKCINCNKLMQTNAQLKQGELLETPTLERQKEDNQQPSLSSNTFEGSTTNSRIHVDSNADTSALQFNIKRDRKVDLPDHIKVKY